MKVLICAGGTGGHIYPALAAAGELERQGVAKTDMLWLGTRDAMEETLVPREGYTLKTLAGGAVVSSAPPHVRMMNAARLFWSIGTASQYIRRFRPDVLFMTGGFTAVPVSLAAWLQRIPIGIYLPDVEPGAAIKLVAPLARRISCTSERSSRFIPLHKMVVTGYPVRPSIRAATQLSQPQALAQFNLLPGRRTLFVFGGSRGAQAINRALMSSLPQLLPEIQVIHISGTLTWPEVEAYAATLPDALRAYYRPFPYLHEPMGAAFRAADLVLARAGASMLGECPAFGLPAILVPLTFAWRYQKVNADYLTERETAVQSTDEELKQALYPLVMGLLRDDQKLAQMSAAAKALDKPQAATHLAQFILQLGQVKQGAQA